MDTLDPEVPEHSTPGSAPEQRSRKPRGLRLNLDRINGGRSEFLAAIRGVVIALRSIVLSVALTAIVIAPVVLVDSTSTFGAKALFDSTTWGWLLVNGAPPRVGAATFTLLPWGLALLPWLLNYFGARALARRFSNENRLIAVSISFLFITYVSAVVLAAAFVESINISYSVWATLVVAVLVNGTAVVAGVLSVTHTSILIPEILRFIVVRGTATVFALCGIGALLVAVLLVANFSDVLFLFNQLNPGYSGFLALTLLSIGYLPVLTVWAVAYFTGAGFTIGPDVMVSPFIPVTAPTQLPPFPTLAVLPESAGAISWLLPALVIGLGVVVGVGVSLRMSRESVLMRLVIAVGIAVVAAVITMGLAALSVGNLGDVRLVDIGPVPTLVGSLTWLLLTVGMIPAAVVPARLFNRKRPVEISVVKSDSGEPS